jgi:hypothetical protein
MRWAAKKLHPARKPRPAKPKPEPDELNVYDLLYLHLQENTLRTYSRLTATKHVGFTGNPENRINFLVDIENTLKRLSADHRCVALMHHGQGYNIGEIASILHRDSRVVSRWLMELDIELLDVALYIEATSAGGLNLHPGTHDGQPPA